MEVSTAIKVTSLSKRYALGVASKREDTVAGTILQILKSPYRNFRNLRRLDTSAGGDQDGKNSVWALKDITFQVEVGEVLGFIGRNGAGKSTLLKILSRVTSPTKGRAEIWGRMGSLLEVGTGFHPDLTGEENIFLQGAILGMTKGEIRDRYRQIVDFSGVKKFLQTPVKRYSSGMRVRLAFSVAAHLQPEILVVDEVLAVGDATFQSKCLEKMKGVAETNRTILFVSHNLSYVDSLCSRVVYLENGRALADGDPREVIGKYLATVNKNRVRDLSHRKDRSGTGESRLTGILIAGQQGERVAVGEPARITVQFSKPVPGMTCSVTIYELAGAPVVNFSPANAGETDRYVAGDVLEFVLLVDSLTLVPGEYRINASLRAGGQVMDRVEGAVSFTVEPAAVAGRAIHPSHGYGPVFMNHSWIRPGL